MLIGIDGRPFYGATAGTGRYVTELCRALDTLFPQATFHIYANRPVSLPVSSPRWQVRSDDSPLWGKLPPGAWYFARAGRLAARDKVNLFWGCANFLPLGLPPHIPAVLTVYDLVFHLYPHTMSFRHRLAYTVFFQSSLRRANAIVAISQGTAARLKQAYGVPVQGVVKPQASPWFRQPEPTSICSVRSKYGLPARYLLSVSTLEPRKNLIGLVQALQSLSLGLQAQGLTLVLVGQRGWKNQPLLQSINTARQSGVRIIETGFIPDADLPALYAGAVAVVMPSLYEGFGMPILEALHCGATVMATDTPETREAGGHAAMYVAPGSRPLARALAQLWNGHPTKKQAVCSHHLPASNWQTEGVKLADVFKGLL